MNKKIIMSWSKVLILLGKTAADGSFATALFNLGVINDKSTSLTTEDGETLTAKATGGVVVAEENGEPILSVTTRVKEMDFATEAKLIKAVEDATKEELVVSSNVVDDDYSLKVVPKNVGSIGIKARRTHVTCKPGYSEEEGHYVDVTFKILACDDGELYTKFRVKPADLTLPTGGA